MKRERSLTNFFNINIARVEPSSDDLHTYNTYVSPLLRELGVPHSVELPKYSAQYCV